VIRDLAALRAAGDERRDAAGVLARRCADLGTLAVSHAIAGRLVIDLEGGTRP
jgi:hypothetical protein